MDGGSSAALHEHLGKHGGGGGLSVCAAHADGGVKPLHQLAQQRSPLNGRQAQALQLHALGVVGQNGHGVNHQIRAVHVFGMVADGDGNVQVVPQVAGGVGFQIVRPGNDISLSLSICASPLMLEPPMPIMWMRLPDNPGYAVRSSLLTRFLKWRGPAPSRFFGGGNTLAKYTDDIIRWNAGNNQ